MKCEACHEKATHVCSGLDVPALYFCKTHANMHQAAIHCGGVIVMMNLKTGRAETEEGR